MIIRKANKEDSFSIMMLSKELGYGSTEEEIKNRINYLSKKDQSFLVVAEEEDNVVGFISYEHYETVYYVPGINITGLVVFKDFRNKGIGKRLLNYAEEYAKSKSLSFVRLNSGIQRKEAHSFYKNNGYDNIKEQIRFIKNFKEI